METIVREELARDLARGAIVLIDVRGAKSFALGHIAGAIHIPRSNTFDDTASTALEGELRPLVVYCQNEECTAAEDAAQQLDALGHQVRVYLGGLDDWEAT